jgi:hypothetical protein
MRAILSALIYLLTLRFRDRKSLELEIVALRHQLNVLRRKKKLLPKITRADRCIWSCFYQVYPRARHWMQIVKPETVRIWRDLGFHLGRSHSKGRPGRKPKVNDGLRRLIFQMYNENAGWGFVRIHAELRKLGYDLVEQTVRASLPKHRLPPTPGWRTFFQNHRDGAAAISVVAIIAVISFRFLQAMIFIGLESIKLSFRSSTQSAEKSELVNTGSNTLAQFPWSKPLDRDRNRCDIRRACDNPQNFGVNQRLAANRSVKRGHGNRIVVVVQ